MVEPGDRIIRIAEHAQGLHSGQNLAQKLDALGGERLSDSSRAASNDAGGLTLSARSCQPKKSPKAALRRSHIGYPDPSATHEPSIMALTRELDELACSHGKCAELARADAMRDLERSVYGCDYGGNGGATRLEAERVFELLELRLGVRLLDVGAGSGWPALYLAQISGCDLVMVDIPLASLRIARERAVADGLAQRCEIIAADAAALPFRDASFDAFNHSDVLCCTPDKLGVLRSCRRVARDGARMTFTTISLAPSLPATERGIAMGSGPRFMDSEEDYAALLRQSGWSLRERIDLTSAYLSSMWSELDGMKARADALTQVFGQAEFTRRMQRQQAAVAAIDAGFVRRELFVAQAGG